MKIDFMGIPVDSHTMDETIDRIDKAIRDGEHISHVVINAGKVVSMMKDKDLFDSVLSCDIINADGQSIIWAAKFLGKKLPGRVAGIDLMQRLVMLSAERGYKCFFFGAKEEIVKKVVEKYSQQYGPQIIAGYRNGYFREDQEPQIARQIAESGANMLFVAITSPKKEKFLHKYEDVLKVANFTMGVGGTFDIIAGITKRAPKWVQSLGMEWFVRLAQEPRRMWKRYLVGNTTFIYLVMKYKLTGERKISQVSYNMTDRVLPDITGGISSQIAGGVSSSTAGGVPSRITVSASSNITGGASSNAGGSSSNITDGASSNTGGASSNITDGASSNAGGSSSNTTDGASSNTGGSSSNITDGASSNIEDGN